MHTPKDTEQLRDKWRTHHYTEDGWIPIPTSGPYRIRSPINEERAFHQFQEQLDEAKQNKKKRIKQVQVRMRQPATVVAQLNTNRFLQNLILKLGRSSGFRFLSEDCEEFDFLQHMLKEKKIPVRMDRLLDKVNSHLLSSPEEFMVIKSSSREQLFQLREQVDLHFGKLNQRRIREIIVEATLAIEEFRSTQNRVSAADNREPFECFVALKRLTPEKIPKIKEMLRKAHRKEQQQKKRLLPGRKARDQAKARIWMASCSATSAKPEPTEDSVIVLD